VVFDHFIGMVAKRRRAVRSDLKELRDFFVDKVCEREPDQTVHHLARCFGHIYAAGILAARFKVVPWSEELVLKCVRRSYRAARRQMNTEAELLRRGLRRLSARAVKRTMLLRGQYSGQPLRDGYRRCVFARLSKRGWRGTRSVLPRPRYGQAGAEGRGRL
jgi:hypothetical protein